MKHSIVLAILSLAFWGSHAQDNLPEYVFSTDRFSRASVALAMDSLLFLGGSTQVCESTTLFTLNTLDRRADKHTPTNGNRGMDDLKIRHSDSIVVGSMAWRLGDDYASEEDGPYIFGLDREGGMVFESYLPYSEYGNINNGYHPVYIAPLPGNDMVIATANRLVLLDSVGGYGGILYESYTMGLYERFLGVHIFKDSLIMAHTSGRMLLFDGDGMLIDSLFSESEIRDVHVGDGKLFILESDRIIEYAGPGQNVTYHTTHIGEIATPEGLTGNATHLFVYEKLPYEDDGIPELAMLELPDLAFGGKVALGLEDADIMDVVATDEVLHILGRTYLAYSINNYPLPFVKTLPLFSPPDYQWDISISNLQSLNELQLLHYVNQSGDTTYYFDNTVPSAFQCQITNHGPDTLRSFSLVGSGISYTCFTNRYIKEFPNENIAPGESAWVSGNLPYPVDYITPGYTYTVGMRACSPNHYLDVFPSDNFAETQVVTSPVRDPVLVGRIDLSPNPARETLRLDIGIGWSLDGAWLDIHDALGRLVMRERLSAMPPSGEMEVGVGHLPTGWYSASLRTGEGAWVGKFEVAR